VVVVVVVAAVVVGGCESGLDCFIIKPRTITYATAKALDPERNIKEYIF
jgi:hypothetical protein